MASEKITALIEEVKALTVLELSELVKALEEEFGVSAAAMAAPAAGAAAPAAEEKTEFDVVLTGFDAAAKILNKFAEASKGAYNIKGGFMEGKPVDLATIQSLAAIPALPVLQAQVLGTMLAPITGLAVVLKQIAEKQGAPAEEPAAE